MDAVLGIGFVFFLALFAPLIPLAGGGISAFPALGGGLGSMMVAWVTVIAILAIVVIGLRSRATPHGKGIIILGIVAWLFWGIACMPHA